MSTRPYVVCCHPSQRRPCCLHQLFATVIFIVSDVTCHVQCPDVSLCFDSSDAQFLILCYSHWSFRWSCYVSTMSSWLMGLPTAQLHQLQSIYSMLLQDWYVNRFCMTMSLRCSKTFTGCNPPECISFKLDILIYQFLHGLAPQYMPSHVQHVANCNCRRLHLVICCMCLATVSDCAFPEADSRLWNSLPYDVSDLCTDAYRLSEKSEYLSIPSILQYWQNCLFCLVHTMLSGLAVFILRPLY